MKVAPDGITTHGDVYITTGTTAGVQKDLAVPLMLGTAQGGLEVSGNADRRPAPNGIVFSGNGTEPRCSGGFAANRSWRRSRNLTLEVFTPQPSGAYLAVPGPPIYSADDLAQRAHRRGRGLTSF